MTHTHLKMIKCCSIKNNTIYIDHQTVYHTTEESFDSFIELAYRNFKFNYPKFFKMDRLAKLGFIAAEFLLQDQSLLSRYAPDKIGLILANQSSSLDTDLKYADLMHQGIPSPATFVYTLPNIVNGEICIRHGIKGENTFFISDDFEINTQVDYIMSLFHEHHIDACIGGWVELLDNQYECFMYLVEANQDLTAPEFSINNIQNNYYKSQSYA